MPTEPVCQELSKNGMTIVITPKDEGLRDKSLKQCKWHKINAIKESQKFRTYGPP